MRSPNSENQNVIAFLQPFALRGPGGGARILRSLLQAEHPPVISINTASDGLLSGPASGELHGPLRRSFGRLEYTRFHPWFGIFDQLGSRKFAVRLRRILRERRVRLVHVVHQSYDIVPIGQVVRELQIPLFLTIHDDYEYMLQGHPGLSRIAESVGNAWRGAKGVFVISEEMGREYARRFGEREYTVVTDGLSNTAAAPLPRSEKSLRVYFMGLFHYTYRRNFRAVLDALKILREKNPDWKISVTSRSGSISVGTQADDVAVRVLPFASEAEIEKDLRSADLLYQPMPFQADSASFGKFSLSTKMITYLGSGLPIFYHGPDEAAAYQLLRRHRAAALCTTLDPESIAADLLGAMAHRESVTSNALALARSQFLLADQQQRFWHPILQELSENQPAVCARLAQEA